MAKNCNFYSYIDTKNDVSTILDIPFPYILTLFNTTLSLGTVIAQSLNPTLNIDNIYGQPMGVRMGVRGILPRTWPAKAGQKYYFLYFFKKGYIL
jgi:hypothetical protein